MFKQLKQYVVLMQILIQFEVLHVWVNEVTEEEKELKWYHFLEILINVRELEQSLPGSQITSNLLILLLLIPIVVLVLTFVFLCLH
jgi:hypothetical protein